MAIYEADYDDAGAVTKLVVEAVAPRGDSLAGRRAGLEKYRKAMATPGLGYEAGAGAASGEPGAE